MMIEEIFQSKKQPNSPNFKLVEAHYFNQVEVVASPIQWQGSWKKQDLRNFYFLLAVKNGLDRCANSFVTLSKSIKKPEPETELWRAPIQVFFCKKSKADLFSICSLKMQLNLAESIILLYNMFNFSKATYHSGFQAFSFFSSIILLIRVLT